MEKRNEPVADVGGDGRARHRSGSRIHPKSRASHWVVPDSKSRYQWAEGGASQPPGGTFASSDAIVGSQSGRDQMDHLLRRIAHRPRAVATCSSCSLEREGTNDVIGTRVPGLCVEPTKDRRGRHVFLIVVHRATRPASVRMRIRRQHSVHGIGIPVELTVDRGLDQDADRLTAKL